jgi:hypothetical protein
LWDEFHYQRTPGPKEQQFALLVQAALKNGASAARGRIVFALQDERNYYFAEFTPKQVWLGKVENGFEIRLGSHSPVEVSPGTAHEVLIKRHAAPITVALDGVVVASAYDDNFGSGDLALGSIDNEFAFSDLKAQPLGEVYRSDDFMRNEGDQGLWEVASGNWQVNAINNPTMSTNAFYYIGSSPTDAAVTWGFWFWDNYSFKVACKPLEVKAVGIYTYYRDKDNNFLLKWTSATGESPKLQLIRRFKGAQTVLAEKAGGFTPNQWYVLQCDVTDQQICAFIDDQLILTAEDPALCLGKVGLYVEGNAGAHFDDALVKSVRTFTEDFRTFSSDKWIELGGTWRLAAAPAAPTAPSVTQHSALSTQHSLIGSSPIGSAKAVTGESRWSNYTLSADIGPCASGRAGLCFYYQDELNYYAFLWGRGPALSGVEGSEPQRQLIKMVDGKRTVIAHDVAPDLKERHRVSLCLDTGHIAVVCDGAPLFEEFDNSLTEGKIGLIAEDTSEASFANVQVEFLTEKQPLMTVHEVFSRERTMEEWAGEQSDWSARTDTVAGATFSTNWHRADFPGNVDIEMKQPADFPPNGQIKMMIASDAENLDGGYCFTLAKSGGYKATLTRCGKPVGAADIDEKTGLDQLLFRRTGNYIVAFIGRRAIVSFRDREPLKGMKVGWSTSNIAMKNQDIEVYSESVQNYSFKEAESDWRVASGIWEVTNRWQCDPRWSFFSGRSPRLAAIWNKRELSGDVTLEFYAAIKMDAERGRRYEYAADLNCTLCADGKDLTSGYNFLFGGWSDSRSAIMRADKIVAETAGKVIPREENIHRRWFYLKARKHGNKLEFHLDNNLILEYTDPNPLTGTRAAIWTYNNGMMVSRVRLSCTDARRKESPITPQPSSCKSIYDQSAAPAAPAAPPPPAPK